MGKCILTRRGEKIDNINFEMWEYSSGSEGYSINKKGWITNINANSYIGINKPFIYTKSFEIMINFIITTIPTRSNVLFGSCVSSTEGFYKAPSLELQPNCIWAGFSYNGTTWDKNMYYNLEYELNKEYYLKYSYDVDSKILKLELSFDEKNWNTISTETDVNIGYQGKSAEYLQIGGVAKSKNHYFTCGEINVFKSYIKTNGAFFWGIQYE